MTRTSRLLEPPPGDFFLLGPRGTGKSTWLRSVFPKAFFVDLLDAETERSLTARPERLAQMIAAQRSPQVVVIDEVQKVPALLDVVHQLMEQPGAKGKRRPRFVLTGSSARKLRRGGVNLLGGRAALLSMHPFMASELGESFHLDRALREGLLPVVTAPAGGATSSDDALRAYVSLYVREEVQFEGLARKMASFARFVEAVSFSHASQLNLAEAARESQTPRATIEGYISILEDLLLAYRLPVFTRRAKRQLVDHPKFYWFDAGVYRAFRPAGPLDRPEEIDGAALEGLVAQHLRAWIAYSRRKASLSFWRTRAGNEVDFVVYGERTFVAIEVTNSARVRPKDLSGLRSFGADYPEARRVLLYRGRDRLLLDGVHVTPIADYLKSITPKRDLP